MSVWIAREESARWSEAGANVRDISRDDLAPGAANRRECCVDVADPHGGFPVHKVVRALVGRHWAAAGRRQIVQELDLGPGLRGERRDANAAAGHAVQALLLGAEVLTPAHNPHTEQVAVEGEARF